MSPTPPNGAAAMLAELPDAVAKVARSVVGVQAQSRCARAASGTVWQAGVVVAPAHALWRAQRVRVVLPDGESVDAEVKGLDAGTDLAALVLAEGGREPPPLDHAADRERRAGEFVFAVARDASGLTHASFGHVGSSAGAWRSWRGGRIDRLIRLDGGLYPGFSGAPVADASGQAIGVATSALSRMHGIVLPATTVDRVVAQLLAHGRVTHGYLGLALQPVKLSDAQAAALGVSAGGGLLVASVADDGPAAAAGVLLGDTLVELGGTRVASLDDLRDALGGERIGAALRAVVLRAGARVELSVVIAERPRGGRCG